MSHGGPRRYSHHTDPAVRFIYGLLKGLPLRGHAHDILASAMLYLENDCESDRMPGHSVDRWLIDSIDSREREACALYIEKAAQVFETRAKSCEGGDNTTLIIRAGLYREAAAFVRGSAANIRSTPQPQPSRQDEVSTEISSGPKRVSDVRRGSGDHV